MLLPTKEQARMWRQTPRVSTSCLRTAHRSIATTTTAAAKHHQHQQHHHHHHHHLHRSSKATSCWRRSSTSWRSRSSLVACSSSSSSASTSLASLSSATSPVVPIWPVAKHHLEEALGILFESEATRSFVKSAGFAAEEGQVLPIPQGDEGVSGWLFGVGDGGNPFAFGSLPRSLPPARYEIVQVVQGDGGGEVGEEVACLGWGLGSYAFKRYKTSSSSSSPASADGKDEAGMASSSDVSSAVLCVADEEARREAERIVEGVFLGRDLINTPCSDLGPSDLAKEAERLGKAHGASVKVIRGSELERGFPLVHAVGRAASSGREPLVVDLNWGKGDSAGKLVTIVGKGVCFDTGGLDIKPPSSMLTMKKDMGGAASVLGLASMIMSSKLDLRLRVLLPCVENAIAGNAFRPSDVLTSRSGLTVEIGNTDAEGRLILADCLTLATESDEPDVLLDMATLTGAHRVALGWDLPGIFTDNEDLAGALYEKGMECHDPVWRLPLWKPYAKMLDSKVADMNNIGSAPWGGAITAALFLQKFTNNCPNWVHIDFNGWTREKPGFPEGGEPQAVRGIYKMLKERYGVKK